MRNEYREIILESKYKRDWYTELWMAFKSYPHCSKIGAMTHISNNLAARLSTGVLQRKWRMRGRGALSIVHLKVGGYLPLTFLREQWVSGHWGLF